VPFQHHLSVASKMFGGTLSKTPRHWATTAMSTGMAGRPCARVPQQRMDGPLRCRGRPHHRHGREHQPTSRHTVERVTSRDEGIHDTTAGRQKASAKSLSGLSLAATRAHQAASSHREASRQRGEQVERKASDDDKRNPAGLLPREKRAVACPPHPPRLRKVCAALNSQLLSQTSSVPVNRQTV